MSKTRSTNKKCKVKNCDNKARHGTLICHKHVMRKWRKENPLLAAYTNLKSNAKRRGKEFSLTIEQFKKFCIKTEYIVKRGIRKYGYSIDRIDNDKGYTIDNIRAITNSENISKENKRRMYLKHDGQYKFGFYDGIDKNKSNDEKVPF